MPRMRRPRRERTHDWHHIQQWTLWPEQTAYELLRPVVLFNEPASARAQETGASERTLQYKATQFDERGMASLFPKEPARPTERSHSLPPDMRQLIVDLKAEYPAFRPHEIATICFVRFGRKPSPHTVKQVLADGPKPLITMRRFPPYGQIVDPFQRRRAIVQLHSEGWNIKTIALYMQTPRTKVYEILRRWVAEGFAGLDDKSHAPHEPVRKVSFQEMNEIRRLARNPELGAFRVRAALEQLGISLSQATCGRYLSLNRRLFGLEKPKRSPGKKREMPYRASFRHQWWSVDVRYIEEHQIPDHHGPLYQITILENYSRAALASKISATQDQWVYLEVLFHALSTAGVPKGIVSDGGGIFYCTQAMHVYKALGIDKQRIDPGQAWQNYVESMFNISRRMGDAHYAQATSWAEAVAIHRKWMMDYNAQRHWAHEKRDDGCHSPAQVIGWHKGTMYPHEVLNRLLFATRYTRHLDQQGYLRFQHWKLYGERGLADEEVAVWVYEGTLKVEYKAVTLSQYKVELEPDRKHIKEVSRPRICDTPFRSPQLTLIELSPDEWRLYWRAPSSAPSHRKRPTPGIIQLPLFETPLQELAVGAEQTRLKLLPLDQTHG